MQVKCPDCAVEPGQEHRSGCDVERCPACGHQRLSCGCAAGKLKPLPWTGEWPGVAECREFGWYAFLENGWHRCSKDHPKASEDLNRLYTDAKWDVKLGRFIIP